MKLFLAAFAIFVTFVHAAPSTQLIYYNTNPLLPGRAIYKLPQTIFQSTTSLKYLEDGKQTFYYILPTSTAHALTYPYEIIMVRDDPAPGNNFDFWQVIQNWFGQGQGESGAAGGEAGASPEQSAEMKKIMDKFEMFDKEGNKMPEAMKKDEIKKLYILSQQPQFFSSYQLLSPYAINSPFIYRPLIGRSQKLEAEQPVVPVEQPVLAVVPGPVPVVQEPVPLVKAVEPVGEPVLVVDPLIAANPVPVSPVAQEKVVPEVVPIQARAAIEAEKEMIEEMIAEKEMEKKEEEPKKEELLKEELKIEQKNLEIVKEADDASVAQAKPEAIALSGKGGLSAASPVATSITGDGGVAVAAPQATSISGDFPVVEEEKKQ